MMMKLSIGLLFVFGANAVVHGENEQALTLPKSENVNALCSSTSETKEPIPAAIKAIRKRTCMLSNAEVEKVVPGRTANPANVLVFEEIVSEARFNELFPQCTCQEGSCHQRCRHHLYSYLNLMRAVAKFPGFCTSKAVCKHSLITMFAHFQQETWGLYYLKEINKGAYCQSSGWSATAYPCQSGQLYFGRGSKQLSWNYNYGMFSEVMFGDATIMLKQPDLASHTWLNFAAAVWFFMTPQPPKPSMLDIIDKAWTPTAADTAAGRTRGFGATIMVLNGAIECGKGSATSQAANRVVWYKKYAAMMSVDISSERLTCHNMKAFVSTGSEANMHWDRNWGSNPTCELKKWQNAWSALIEGNYAKCCSKYGFSCKGNSSNGNSDESSDSNSGGGDSTLRCGASWADAKSCDAAGCPSGKDAECPSGQGCFKDMPVCSNSNSGSKDNSKSGGDSTLRCGASWADAKSCSAVSCPKGTDAECPSGQGCFKDMPVCASNSVVSDSDDKSNSGGDSTLRCGASWAAAKSCSAASCPKGTDAECPSGQGCYKDMPVCSSSPVSSPVSAPTSGSVSKIVPRCGATWADANKCGTNECPSGIDGECTDGEKCFGGMKACASNGNSPTPPPTSKSTSGGSTTGTLRCGATWGAANLCGQTACPDGTNANCPTGETCFKDLVKCAVVQSPVAKPTVAPVVVRLTGTPTITSTAATGTPTVASNAAAAIKTKAELAKACKDFDKKSCKTRCGGKVKSNSCIPKLKKCKKIKDADFCVLVAGCELVKKGRKTKCTGKKSF